MTNHPRLMTPLLAGVLVVACTTTPVGPNTPLDPRFTRVRDCSGPAVSLDPAIVATLAPRTGSQQPDDSWADLAATVPGGFAGVLYVDGKPVLMLTDPSKAAAAKAALAGKVSGFDVAGAEVHAARWDFLQLVNWYDYLAQKTPVWTTRGMVAGDKDEAINRIRFGVADSTAINSLAQTLNALQIPCDLVAVDIEGILFDSRQRPRPRVSTP